jgi:hypothetical protein
VRVRLLAALGGASFVLASLVVGVRLLVLFARTRGWPELFAATAILTVGPIAFALFVPAVELAERNYALSRSLYIVASGFATLGTAAVVAFTMAVFHAGRLARAGTLAVIGVLAASWIGIVATDDLDLRRLPGLWRNVNTFLQIAVFLWASLESLAFWRMMRRRTLLGIADPLLTHRFALWGIALGVGSANLSASFVGLVLRRAPPGVTELAIGIAGVLCAVCLTLAFLPPRRYQAWIRRDILRAGSAGARR